MKDLANAAVVFGVLIGIPSVAYAAYSYYQVHAAWPRKPKN